MLNKLLPLIILLSIVLLGCDSGSNPYTSTGNFQITYPADWEKQGGQGMVKSMALSPLEGPGDSLRENVNVVVEPLPYSASLSEYVKASKKYMQSDLSSFSILSESDAKIDGMEATRIVYEHSLQGMKIKGDAYLLVAGNNAYVITCTASPTSYDQYVDQFDSVVQTFKVQ